MYQNDVNKIFLEIYIIKLELYIHIFVVLDVKNVKDIHYIYCFL